MNNFLNLFILFRLDILIKVLIDIYAHKANSSYHNMLKTTNNSCQRIYKYYLPFIQLYLSLKEYIWSQTLRLSGQTYFQIQINVVLLSGYKFIIERC